MTFSLTKDSFNDHLEMLQVILLMLLQADLWVNAEKSSFGMDTNEYM